MFNINCCYKYIQMVPQKLDKSLSSGVMILDQPLPPIDQTQVKKNFSLCCEGRFRFNLVFVFIPIFIMIIPFLCPSEITFAVNGFYAIQLLLYMILATVNHCRIQKRLKIEKQVDSKQSQIHQVTLVLITFVYKQPIELIRATIQNLKEQTYNGPIILAICFQQRTPERMSKIEAINIEFGDSFQKLLITVHPANIVGEIPGKCSNCNYGSREVYRYLLKSNPNLNLNDYIVTNFDIDTRFHPDFLKHQTEAVVAQEDRSNVIWQPILYYNWNLDKLSFITRVTGLIRNAMMMGALTPLNLNVMSVYTATLKIWVEGNFTHPAYQMDDIICYIRWMIQTKSSITIKPIYSPVLSGPTSGTSFCLEIVEWARQIRRWSIGSAQVFHYFVIKFKNLNFLTGFLWGINYMNYYVGFLCASPLLMVSTAIYNIISKEDGFNRLYFFILLGLFYLCMLWIFIMNAVAIRNMKSIGVVEDISYLRNVFHLLMSLFVLVLYAFVAMYGFIESVARGKKVCKHGASNKSSLQNL